MKDFVSVIIPFYNDGEYIQESVNSVLNQTYSNIEIIIVDDGSDDANSIKILNQIEFPNLKKIRIAHHGPSAARNKAIEICNGEWILPLDADDTIESTYIAKAVYIMKTNSNMGIVYCLADQFGEAKGPWQLPQFNMGKMLLNNIIFVTALFRKKDWDKIGGFDETFEHGIEDYDFWLSILGLGRNVYQIPECLFHYRIKKKSRNKNIGNSMDLLKGYFAIIQNKHRNLYIENFDQFANEIRNAFIEEQYKCKTLHTKYKIKKYISKLKRKIINLIIRKQR